MLWSRWRHFSSFEYAAALAVVAITLLAGCSSGAHSVAQNQHATALPIIGFVLSRERGEQICGDLQNWLGSAWNQDAPRFDQTMTAAESEARPSQLGKDLQMLDLDLQASNSEPLFPGPPGEPSDLQVLQRDCKAYGTTVRTPS